MAFFSPLVVNLVFYNILYDNLNIIVWALIGLMIY